MSNSSYEKFPAVAGGGGVWGTITGVLSDQTDLQTALNAKQATITTGSTAQYFRGDLSLATLDKTAVGLGNVDNTSDANKPVSTATQTALNAKLNAARRKRSVTTKAGAYSGTDSSTIAPGNWTSCTSHVKHYAPTTTQISEMEFAFSNWIVLSQEQDGANDITVKANIVYNSVSYPIFFNGVRSILIKPGATVWSDPVGVEIPPGGSFFSSTYVVVTAAQTWPLGRTPLTSLLEGNNLGADTTDVTTWAATTGALVYSPSGIRGTCYDTTTPSVIYYGDSIAVGYGDTGDAYGNMGFLERAFQGTCGYTSAARSADTLINFGIQHSKATALGVNWADSAIIQYGRNDITASMSFATFQTTITAQWNLQARRGLKVFQSTITPRTNSTDSWATTGNQSIPSAPQELVRTQVNDWIRTTPAPLSGYIDLADACETTRNSGIWIVNGTPLYATPDGTHLANATAILGAAKVTVSAFLLP